MPTVDTNASAAVYVEAINMARSSAPAQVTHYHKRSWRAETPGYVYWDTTDSNGAYPGGGTLTPATGVILFKWVT